MTEKSTTKAATKFWRHNGRLMEGAVDKVRGNYSYMVNETGYYMVETSELMKASDATSECL
ncbi:hypothetical protein C900_04476 [Fulvivirga imtechensis AK7]|uniref:Uncharacterized protein n=1 Tax=Fulvivirga imtechensis AK7 TaxID=1237149 RepID=L8JP29_9BACT|nr:hypothetical protein [Fulvivirga imtechensis]ELR69953.1 hypothetical protein C900_04476 [Fulvivirga imtechensis AK7]